MNISSDGPAAMINLLQCPSCTSALLRHSNGLQCVSCGTIVQTPDNIIDFVAGTVSTQLDDIDYDTFYSINDGHAGTTYATIAATAGTLWPDSIGDAMEVGCGTGGFSMAILARMAANRVLLTDVSVKMLTICRNRLNRIPGLKPAAIGYATWSTQEAPFRADSFDTCFGTAVVHHILDVQAFLQQVHRALKPGGLAFFLEPNAPFHKALVATLADIAAAWLGQSVAPDTDVVRMISWIGEVHCNIVNSGDMEVLTDREDKHLFVGADFIAMAAEAGFDAKALACGPDPTGIETIEAIMGQVGVSTGTMQLLRYEWQQRQNAYFGRLEPADRAPSYLFWLRKRGGPVWDDADLRMWLTLRLEHSGTGCDLIVDGWCVAGVAVRAVELAWAGMRRRVPVWRPRPDVQQVINANRQYPNLHALCSGISARLPVGHTTSDPLEVEITALCADGTTIRRGTVTLRLGDEPVTVQ